MERGYLRPNKRCPVPLNENFWVEIVGANNVAENADIAHQMNQIYAKNITAEVERTLRENRGDIENAIIKQVAPSAVNVVGVQYENLISLSFDPEEVIKEEENRRRQIRKRIVNAALKKD